MALAFDGGGDSPLLNFVRQGQKKKGTFLDALNSGGGQDLMALLQSFLQGDSGPVAPAGGGSMRTMPFSGPTPRISDNPLGAFLQGSDRGMTNLRVAGGEGGSGGAAGGGIDVLGSLLSGGSNPGATKGTQAVQAQQNNPFAQLYLNPESLGGPVDPTLGGLVDPTANSPVPGMLSSGGPTPPQNVVPGQVLSPDGSAGSNWEDQLIQQLNALAMSGAGPIDTESMIADAAKGINQIYGSQIASIRHQNQGARADTKEGTREIRKMYAALARDMAHAGRTESKQSDALAAKLQKMGQQATQNNVAAADQLLSQNAAAAENLGAPGIMTQLNKGVNKQTGNVNERLLKEAQLQATNQTGLGGVSQRFFNTAGGTSRIEGTNRSADLIGDLQDYLQGNRDKIGEIQGQKSLAMSQARNDILNQAAQATGDQQQQLFGNMMAIAQLKMDIEAAQQKAMLDEFGMGIEQQKLLQGLGAGGTDVNSYRPDNLYNASQLINSLNNPSVASDFSEIVNSPEFMQGQVDFNGGTASLQGNPAALMSIIQKYAGDAGYDPMTMQKMMEALYMYAQQLPSAQQ